MNAIATTKPNAVSCRPAEQSRSMADLIAKFTNRLEDAGGFNRHCIPSPVAPTAYERAALERRKADLLASFQPDAHRTRKALLALLGSFSSYGEDEESARFVLAGCCRACAKAPVWALEEASDRFMENMVRIRWDNSKRPTAPQILAEALHCALPVEAELHRISSVLNAEIVDCETTNEERQAAIEAWSKLKAEIGGSNIISERTSDEITRERAEMARVNERFRARKAAFQKAVSQAIENETENSVVGTRV